MGLQGIFGADAGMAAGIVELKHEIRHVPKYGGENWYVSKNGLDTNSGERPDD